MIKVSMFAETSNRIRTRLYHGVGALALAAALVPQPLGAAAAEIDLPAQSTELSLLALAEQASVQIMFEPAVMNGHRSKAVAGSMSVEAALSRLLNGNGLTFTRVSDTVYVVEQGGAGSTAEPSQAAPDGEAGADEDTPDDQPTAAGIAEIVVTATRTSTTLQEAAIAVSVFSEETLLNQRITRPADFIALTPNAVIREGSHANQTFVTIRGDAQTRNTETPIAVVVDGVLRTGRSQLQQELFDIEQVEVLKGPQGFLYGRNAIAGAIAISTRKPGNEWSGQFNAGFGSDELVNARFGLGGAIIEDQLYFRVGGSIRDHNGHFRNVTRGELIDPETEKAGRVRLLYEPVGGNFSADFKFQYSDFKGASTLFVPLSAIPGLQRTPENADLDINNVENSPFVRNVDSVGDSEEINLSLKMDYTTPFGTFTSVTSYDDVQDMWSTDDFPYTPVPDETQFNLHFHEAFSQEIRFASSFFNDRLRYIVGAYYLDINDTPNVHAAVGDDPGGFVLDAFTPRPPGDPNATNSFISDDVFTEAWAVFFNVDFDITETLELTLAGRFDSEDRRTIDNAPPEFSLTSGQVRQATFEEFQPKVSLNWRPTSDLTFYASFATGFQAGGFNGSQTNDRTGGLVPNEFAESTADNFEGGFKSRWLDGRLTVNGAVFYNEKRNAQQFIFIPEGTLNAVIQIERVDIVGFELEVRAQPIDGLILDGAIGWLDADVARFDINPAFVGNDAPFAPDLTASFAITHIARLDGIGLPNAELVSSIRYEHRGAQFAETANIVDWRRDPLNLLDARIAIQNDAGWSLAIWGKNLTDNVYPVDVVPIFPDAATRTAAVTRSDPLTWGLELGYRF